MRGPVLVTGATGFIGARLAHRLLIMGLRPRVLCRDPARLAPALRAQAEVVVGDLSCTSSMAAATQGVATVFHCAANVATWGRWQDYQAANVQGVGNLLRALRQAQERAQTGAAQSTPAQAGETRPAETQPIRAQGACHLVHLSSVDVYGFPAVPADEDTPLRPGPYGYGRSKALGERLLSEQKLGEQVADHAPPDQAPPDQAPPDQAPPDQTLGHEAPATLTWTILRPCNVMGPGSPFVQRIGAALRSGPMLTVDGGRADCGYLDVDNLVDVMLWAATAPQAVGQAFNVRDPVAVNWAQFIGALQDGLLASSQASTAKMASESAQVSSPATLRADGRSNPSAVRSPARPASVLNLPYALARAAALALQIPYRLAQPLGLRAEPLLHPLIVDIFGRSCAHDIGKLQRAGAPLGRVSVADSQRAALHALLGTAA